jgi:hypothetical protein
MCSPTLAYLLGTENVLLSKPAAGGRWLHRVDRGAPLLPRPYQEPERSAISDLRAAST